MHGPGYCLRDPFTPEVARPPPALLAAMAPVLLAALLLAATPQAALADSATATLDGVFDALGGAGGVETVTISDRTYALVASLDDRAVQIIDITDPSAPGPVSSITEQDGFDALGGPGSIAITTISGSTYALVTSLDYNAVQIVNITDPASPIPASGIFGDQDGFDAMGGPVSIAITTISGSTYALTVSPDYDSVQIMDITDPSRPDPASGIFGDQDGYDALAGASGIAVAAVSGSTYALVTSNWDGAVQIIDITDPAEPVPVSSVFNGRDGFDALDGAKDVVTTTISDGVYALVASQGDAVQIINITDPAEPVPVSSVFNGRDGFDALAGANHIEVAAVSGSTYALVTSSWDGAVQIIDIADPMSPRPASSMFDGRGGFTALGSAKEVALATIADGAYALVTSPDDDAVQIINITDPAEPVPVSSVFDGRAVFNALGLANDVAAVTISGHTYALVASRGDNAVQIIEITDPAAPLPVSSVFDEQDGFDALGRANDIETTTISGSTYALVTSLDDDAVQIIDITDPAAPLPVSSVFDGRKGFGALGRANGMETATISGSTYALVASHADNAVQIIDITDPAAPLPVSSVFDGRKGFGALGRANGMETATISGSTYALVASHADSAVQIIEITDPAAPRPVSGVFDGRDGFDALGRANDVEVYEASGRTYALVTSQDDNAVQIIDITDPASPRAVSSVFDEQDGFDALGRANDVEVYEASGRTYALVTSRSDNAVQIIDVTDPASPRAVHGVADDQDGFDALAGANSIEVVAISGSTYALVASHADNAVQIIDITDPAAPIPVAGIFDGKGGFTAPSAVPVYDTAPGDDADDVLITDVAEPDQLHPVPDASDGETGSDEPDAVPVLVASPNDNAVQIIDIGDPASPSTLSIILDGHGGFDALEGANGVEVYAVSGRAYALVASHSDDAVQIIDITDPASPQPVSSAFNGQDGFDALDGANDIELVAISGRTYALVASLGDAFQIMDVTDPASPAPISSAFNGQDGFDALAGASDVEAYAVSGRIYAVVTSNWDNAVQIIDITDPASPQPVSSVMDGQDGEN